MPEVVFMVGALLTLILVLFLSTLEVSVISISSTVVIIALLVVFIRIHRVPESEWWQIERWGKGRHRLTGKPHVLGPGLGITIRWLDKIVAKQRVQERPTPTGAQRVMAGNIEINIEGVLYWTIGHINTDRYSDGLKPNGELDVALDKEDIFKSVYGILPGETDPGAGVSVFGNSTLRNVAGQVGTPDFDHLEDSQREINRKIREEMNPAMVNWGTVALRHEITNLLPFDEDLRRKLQDPLRARKEKDSRTLLAEAEKAELINRAQGRQQEEILKAEGQATAAEHMKTVSTKLGEGLAGVAKSVKGLHALAQVTAVALSSAPMVDVMDALGERLRPQLPRRTVRQEDTTER
jgi:regulator of protease activity HflC (stomatin/prohibitin superfamily)